MGAGTGGGDWRDDPALRDLGWELRERVGGEFRLESEENERLAAKAALRARRLTDVVVELRNRGDLVTVATARRAWTGTVLHVGSDFLSLETLGGLVDCSLNLPLALQVVQRSRTGGRGVGNGPTTFRARLLELELAGADVELAASVIADLPPGRLTAVAQDHVRFRTRDGQEWHLALSGIEYVVRRPDPV